VEKKKNVGAGAVEAILEERAKNGSFKDIFNLVERINLTACNKRNLESMALAGAFDCFPEISREQFLAENGKGELFIDTLIRYGNRYQQDKNLSQNSLFGGMDSVEIAKPIIPEAQPWSTLERLTKEKELVGIYLSSHPLDDYYVTLNYFCNLKMDQFEDAKTDSLNQKLRMGGVITSIREGYTKTGNPYAVLKLEDFSGNAEIPLFGDDYINYGKFCKSNIYLYIEGVFAPSKYYSDRIQFQISTMSLLQEKELSSMTISLALDLIDQTFIADISALTKDNPGQSSLLFDIKDPETQLSISLVTSNSNVNIDKKLVAYLENKEIEITVK